MRFRLTTNPGFLLLGIWLIYTGLTAFVPGLGVLGPVFAIIAIVAGILLLLARL
jgi:hypothetical protein